MKSLYRVTAFSSLPEGGNPAGVYLNAQNLSDEDMLKIAKEVGYSETAFVMPSELCDFKVRFFTPVDEVDLCGHATIATFNLLRDLKIIKRGVYTQETKAGKLDIEIYPKVVMMAQNPPVFSEMIPFAEISKVFKGLEASDLERYPIQVVSTGLRDIILPISSMKSIKRLKPDFTAMAELSKKYMVTGIHAFTLETHEPNHSAFARNFAPLYGIDEESATGTSNGALGAYLYRYNHQLFLEGHWNLTIEQGDDMGRPSRIKVALDTLNGQILGVHVGGNACLID